MSKSSLTTALSIVLTVAVTASAHVALDAPNGGEALVVGSTTTIAWHDVVPHGPANYDLWYSTTGPDGPWMVIAVDLQGYERQWVVPDDPSDRVRIRVRQDNAGTDYLDVSDSDLAIVGTTSTDLVLAASADATLYDSDGTPANGAGSYLFTGRNSSEDERRCLLRFAVADQLPADAVIVGASLELHLSKAASGPESVELRRVDEAWSEGPSDPPGEEGGGTTAETGDTTWTHSTFPDTLWTTEGGVFQSLASATTEVDGPGDYTFASAGMVADLQAWQADPDSAFGWALVIAEPVAGSAKRFDSRDHPDLELRPRLTVTYEAPAGAPVANFGFSPASPGPGKEVQFEDRSSGEPTSWQWDFDDGTTSTEPSPAHAFAAAGTYDVHLTVANSFGSDTSEMAITVTDDAEPELSELILIPAVANAAGSGGSFFRTTVDVLNAGTDTVSYRFLWLPRGEDNSAPVESMLLMLEPGEVHRFHDLLGDVFGLGDGVGAAAVLADGSGLDVMSRTANQSAEGTFGQGLPGLDSDELIAAGERVRVMFLSENDDRRSNLGIVNGAAEPITVAWQLYSAGGETLEEGEESLPGFGSVQLNRVLADHAPIEAAYAHLWTTTSGGLFACYGSVLDELTSDPTTVLPRR